MKGKGVPRGGRATFRNVEAALAGCRAEAWSPWVVGRQWGLDGWTDLQGLGSG